MTSDLIDVRKRLISPCRLHQVAALLNMPHLDETTTNHDNTPRARQQMALYTGIADWARLSAQAAELPDASDAQETTEQFTYLIEYTDQHTKGWCQLPTEHSHGNARAETAETVAQTVLPRYIAHLAEHRDDYQLWLTDSFTLQASVWHLNSAERERRGRRPNWASTAHTFKEVLIPPHAIEIRTPSQIRRIMDHHDAP
ncbi:hypothetical protein AB0I81_15700 [Nonomuraea sp. NPDC050404]|uniref:hypothetical protein n=1 Tax=Nonomuraea sp. NPDC050404 TaxID=3155783 RepID=UPI0033CEF0D1